MGFGAGYVGMFLGDDSEGKTEDKGKENTGQKVVKTKSCWIKQYVLPDSLVTVEWTLIN